MRAHFLLEEDVVFLNHGSFGACPRPVLDAQTEIRARMEREPVRFFLRELEPMLDDARAFVAELVGADPTDLAFVRNATAGVNAVLRSLELAAGDEILTTDHAYHACKNALDHVASRAGARVVVADIPFPLADPDEAVRPILAAVSPRTRLALVDHVTSPTGLVLPVERIAAGLSERGVTVLVDGAHAPGMLPLDMRALGALGVAFYTGNFHKWCCAPKGAAMLWARRDHQRGLHPAVISHGYDSPRARPRFLEEFDWTGTDDPSPWLLVPDAVRFLESIVPGGLIALREHNRALALEGRRLLCGALGVDSPAPDAMIGSLAAVPLPDGDRASPSSALAIAPLQLALYERHRIEVPIPPWPRPPKRLVRISAQIYNDRDDYVRLARALAIELGL